MIDAPTKVLLLADTHGVLDPRVAELAPSCDWVVHASDIGGAGILAALRPSGGRVLAVRGNNDVPAKWDGAEHDTLEAIPWQQRLALPGGALVVVHGDRIHPARQRHARLRRAYPDARVVVYGHTHRRVCDLEAEPWVLNPGAAGRARTFGGPSCLILTAGSGGWQVEERVFAPVRAGRTRPQKAKS
jgi:putative phosphoesterase